MIKRKPQTSFKIDAASCYIKNCRDAGTGVHYGSTAPVPFERGGIGALT